MTIARVIRNLVPSVSGGGQALFTDLFASGDLSHEENGISWGIQNVGAGDGSITVVSGGGFGGANGLRFRFAAGARDRWVEQRMDFDPGFNDEFWMRYYFFVPANYNHEGAEAGNNDKFWLAIWGGTYEDPPGPSTPAVDINLWPHDNGTGNSYATAYFFGSSWDAHAYQTNNIINANDRGQWMRLVFGYRLPANSSDYGRIRIWKQTQATGSFVNVMDFVSNDATINDIGQGSNWLAGQSFLDQAYLMGWKNSMNTNQQDFIISHIEIHDSNIFGVV